MAQPDNQHFTTEQLSAYIDKQLSSQEKTAFDTHVQSCERCQGILADLRLTRALLRAMPREEAPRSFALPSNVAVLPQPALQRTIANRRLTRAQLVLRSTIRAVSTIAAVIGLLFIMGGLLTGLASFHGGGASGAAVPLNTSAGSAANDTGTQQARANATHKASSVAPQNQTPGISTLRPTPTPSAVINQGGGPPQPYQLPTVPAVFDISTPVGLLGVGFILFVVGIVGGIAVRRWWRT